MTAQTCQSLRKLQSYVSASILDQANVDTSDMRTKQALPAHTCHQSDAGHCSTTFVPDASIFVCRLTSKFPFPADIIAQIADLPPPSLTQVNTKGFCSCTWSQTLLPVVYCRKVGLMWDGQIYLFLLLCKCVISSHCFEDCESRSSLFLRHWSALFQ